MVSRLGQHPAIARLIDYIGRQSLSRRKLCMGAGMASLHLAVAGVHHQCLASRLLDPVLPMPCLLAGANNTFWGLRASKPVQRSLNLPACSFGPLLNMVSLVGSFACVVAGCQHLTVWWLTAACR